MTRSIRSLLLTSAALLPCALPAIAGPDGANVVAGSASVQGQGTSSVTINQSSDKAIINWQHFNIQKGETTQFIQPSSTSIALNRVTGSQDPTQIHGTLTANGRVFVVNPSGILFGPTAVVNTAGFLATTSDIKNDNFMAGNYRFDIRGRPDASIVNEGRITAHSGGFAALVAPGVRNSGTITATLGKIGLAAANTYTLDFYGDNLINVGVADSIAATVMDVGTGQTISALVKNEGKLSANGGRVELTAVSARKVVDSVINNTGVIEANAVGKGNGGTIVLSAATGTTKGADAPKQVVKLSGTMSASGKQAGQKGGKVVVTGEHIELTGAKVDVAGAAGGGTALIGGDWGGGKPTAGLVTHARAKLENEAIPTATTVTVDSASVIDASATQSGHGGKVVIWSDQMTTFKGTILATGGPLSGDGGFAEVSGRQLAFTGDVDLSALKGIAGTLLLDPEVLHINASGVIEAQAGHSAIAVADIEKQLNSGKISHLIIDSHGSEKANNIYVESNLAWTTNTNLTLAALNNIEFKNAALITNKGTGDKQAAGNLVLRADSDGNGEGTVVLSRTQCGMSSCGLITRDFADWSASTGTVSVYYNPTAFEYTPKYQNPNDYATYVRQNTTNPVLNQATAYMLVNNLTDLQDINTNLSGKYAVGRNIDASATKDEAFTQIGTKYSPFVGVLDGLNYTIDGLTIHSDAKTVGLFTKIGTAGEVRNLSLSNVDITGLASRSDIGAVAGINAGLISNVHVSGSVQGGNYSHHSNIGGLVGTNSGTIMSSSTSGSFTGLAHDSRVGGLVGRNAGLIDYETGFLTAGFIYFSNSSGTVSGSDNSLTGGLVGENQGAIIGSFSFANVNAGANSSVGGLVGLNSFAEGCIDCQNYAFVPAVISSSSAHGTVTAGTESNVGGLVGENQAVISNSFSMATVTGGDASKVGGLVGKNSGFETSDYYTPYNAATISDSWASGPVTAGTSSLVGGLVGENQGDVWNSFSTASVNAGASSRAGGLVGLNSGYYDYYEFVQATIDQSYATGTVVALAGSYVGGLIGENRGAITQSWSGGAATGGSGSYVGGLVGLNYVAASITYSYSLAAATAGSESYVGGLVGLNVGTIDTTYATGLVQGGAGSKVAGLVGSQSGNPLDSEEGTTRNSYWDKDTTRQNNGTADDSETGTFLATGLSTADARKQTSYEGWNFNNDGGDWFMIEGQTRPFLRSEWSQIITNTHQLQLIEMNKGTDYFLTQNIDFAPAKINASDMWSTAGFVPIGSVSSGFTGTFQGLGLNIDNLKIAPNTPGANSVGLFALIGSSGVVENLNLNNIEVTANAAHGAGQFIGTLAGQNAGLISNVTVSGKVDGLDLAGITAGGLVGQNGSFGPSEFPALIENSHATVNVTLGHGTFCDPQSCNGAGFNNAGGLVGFNTGIISGSSAHGAVSIASHGFAGGLVGTNQNATFNTDGPPNFQTGALIENSWASGNVSSPGNTVALGGLVGYNAPKSQIMLSRAIGDVTADANVPNNHDCTNNCEFISAGGLVGQNQGTIVGSIDVPLLNQACGDGQTCATGNVRVGSHGTAGGLVGNNDGIIINSFAALGKITGASGLSNLNGDGGSTNLGGLVGTNLGLIQGSHARGDVGDLNVASLNVGGLAGDNSGTILSSRAIGKVMAGDDSSAGGLVGNNSGGDFGCNGCFPSDGLQYRNTAMIANSHAEGAVTVGQRSVAGGLAGSGDGLFLLTTASGNVTGGGNSVLGGLVGALGTGENGNGAAAVIASQSSGTVRSTGPNSVVGGLVGANFGLIDVFTDPGTTSAANKAGFTIDNVSKASGAVIGTSDSFLGGLVGINLGLVRNSSTTESATVTGTGDNNLVGGLVGLNVGLIENSNAAGNASSGANSGVGELIGAQATFINFDAGTFPISSFPVGTFTNSDASGTASGGPNSDVGGLVGRTNPPTVPGFPSIVNGCDDPGCIALVTGILGPLTPTQQVTTPTVTPPPTFVLPPPSFQQASLTQGEVVNIQQPTPAAPRQQTPGNRNLGNNPDGRPPSGLPPPGETRLEVDKMMIHVGAGMTQQQIEAMGRRFGFTIISSQEFAFMGLTTYYVQLNSGLNLRPVLSAIQSAGLNVGATASFKYALTQEPDLSAKDKDVDLTASIPPQTGPAQYILRKLRLNETHQLAKGSNVLIAVIDSEVDASHPDLQGAVVRRFNAAGGEDKPHAHGTAMAGAIAAQRRLTGMAPGSRVLAVNAFSATTSSAESTTFQILKGIDWAINNGARIINMSFAGPHDPTLARALKAARDKGIVLVAAAGNAGPKSPPLFPGADPNVIAVTATDMDDKLFTMANRGRYIALAAPGVDILVPAPAGSYQTTTGTSVATALVSGVVALLLERDPTLTPNDIRKILTTTAKRMGTTKDRDDSYGSGVIDVYQAVTSLSASKP